jgi:hypothetical protein
MAYKIRLNLRHLHRKTWLPQQSVIERDKNVEVEPIPRTTTETRSLGVLDDDLPHRALRAMFESDSYQVALVPPGKWSLTQGSDVKAFSTVAPALLLPLSWKELVARVCECIRHSNAVADCRVAQFDDVCVDFSKMEVRRSSGEQVALTTQEFETLKCFLLNPDRVFSRDELLNEAWGYENYPATRTVDNHVLKLRHKLERDPANPVHFRTVYGVGYKFVP